MNTATTTADDDKKQASLGDVLPNQTIYVNNLNEKTSIDDLKKSLYNLFGRYGDILEIYAKKTYHLRGQAWIVYSNLASATNAVRQLNGVVFFQKPLRVQYARSKSDVVSKADGTFVMRPKRKKDNEEGKGSEAPKQKRKRTQQDNSDNNNGVTKTKKKRKNDDSTPNNILFLQELPAETTQEMITTLFASHDGYKEVRMVAGKAHIAFVEFENEVQAGNTMKTLQDFHITPEHTLQISFAKK